MKKASNIIALSLGSLFLILVAAGVIKLIMIMFVL